MTQQCLISIRRGGLHFSHDTYVRYFDTLENVVLLRDDCDLIILPVRNPAAGGYVIKLRTASGDRTVQAADFFRDNGIDDGIEMTLPAVWFDDRAALVAHAAFALQS